MIIDAKYNCKSIIVAVSVTTALCYLLMFSNCRRIDMRAEEIMSLRARYAARLGRKQSHLMDKIVSIADIEANLSTASWQSKILCFAVMHA
jgi:hypothetical protein